MTIGREETTQRAWKEGKTLKFAIISHNCSAALGYNSICTLFFAVFVFKFAKISLFCGLWLQMYLYFLAVFFILESFVTTSLPIKSQQKSLASNQHSATIECKKIDLDLILVFLLYSYDYSLLYLYMFCSILLQRQRMKSMNHQSAFHFIYISVFLFHCISYFCSSVFLLRCKSLYFFAAQYSWRRGSKSLVQLLMLDKWSSPLGPLRTYTLIYFWSPPFISWNNSLKFSIYSNGKMMSLSVRPTDYL